MSLSAWLVTDTSRFQGAWGRWTTNAYMSGLCKKRHAVTLTLSAWGAGESCLAFRVKYHSEQILREAIRESRSNRPNSSTHMDKNKDAEHNLCRA